MQAPGCFPRPLPKPGFAAGLHSAEAGRTFPKDDPINSDRRPGDGLPCARQLNLGAGAGLWLVAPTCCPRPDEEQLCRPRADCPSPPSGRADCQKDDQPNKGCICQECRSVIFGILQNCFCNAYFFNPQLGALRIAPRLLRLSGAAFGILFFLFEAGDRSRRAFQLRSQVFNGLFNSAT